ncbi:MAG: hypothetical protein ACPGKS_09590 [Coraliomargarita sp.]
MALPYLIKAFAPESDSRERVPTFSKLISGLGILEDTEVEELTLSEIEKIEAVKSDIRDSLGAGAKRITTDSVTIDLGVLDPENSNQFNNISTGDFVIQSEDLEDDPLTRDLAEFDLQEP